MDNSFDVFISYSRQDYVDENNIVIPNNPISAIKELLSKNNISYWFDEDGIYHGDNFAEKIAANIEKSAILLFLSSASSNASKWTSKEIAAATEWRKKIIPVRLDKSPYNRSVMLYISDLDFVEYYKDPISAQKTVLESIRNYKEELERKRILEEEMRKRQAKEREERERAEKRRQEQAELAKEIANAIHIMRLSEEALEKQRPKIIQQISSLDSKSERKNLLLQLEQSNQAAFEERAKSRLLSETIDMLKADIDNRVKEQLTNGGYVSKDEAEQQCNLAVAKCQEEKAIEQTKQAEEYKARINKLKEKCAALESDFARDEYVQRCKVELNKIQLCLEEEKRNNDSLRNENAQHVARIDTLSKRKKRLHAIYMIVLLYCVGTFAYYGIEFSADSNYYRRQLDEKQRSIDKLCENNDTLKAIVDIQTSLLNQVGETTPLFVKEISVRNDDDDFDTPIYAETSTYIVPKVSLFSLIDGEIELYVKLISPRGLSVGESSPAGFSFSRKITVKKYQLCEEELTGWGSKEKGNWEAGNYRIELYYRGSCIGTRNFMVLAN